MAKSYQDVVNQIEQLKTEAARLRAAEVKGVISRIKEAIATYGLTREDLGLGSTARAKAPKVKATRGRTARRAGAKIAPKYRDSAGNTWTGRGLKPRWLTAAIASGKKLEDFRI